MPRMKIMFYIYIYISITITFYHIIYKSFPIISYIYAHKIFKSMLFQSFQNILFSKFNFWTSYKMQDRKDLVVRSKSSKFFVMSLDFRLFSSLPGTYYRYPSFSHDGKGVWELILAHSGRQVQGCHVRATSGHANPNTITVWVQWRAETTNSRSSWSLLGQWDKNLAQFLFSELLF